MSRLWQREIEEILVALDDFPLPARPRSLGGRMRHLLGRDIKAMNDVANRNRLDNLDRDTFVLDGPAASLAAPLPGLQLGFRWGAGDWALLALWSIVGIAVVAYEVIMVLAW